MRVGGKKCRFVSVYLCLCMSQRVVVVGGK